GSISLTWWLSFINLAALPRRNIHQSVCTCNNEFDISNYLTALSNSVKDELEEFGIDHKSKVLFIGSGAFPISALTIAKEKRVEVMCLDIDVEAVHLAKKVAKVSGLESIVEFSSKSLKELAFIKEATHIIIASLVKNKLEVLDDLKETINSNAKIMLRYGNGLKSIFNYPLEKDLSAEWVQTKITQRKTIYDTIILEKSKALV
ncbi:nicotianamine synthase family protein, partial [Effusibacillus consociatus]